MITSEMLTRMTIEITLDYVWGDPRSQVPATEEHKKAWDKISAEVRAIVARGHVVEIPFD